MQRSFDEYLSTFEQKRAEAEEKLEKKVSEWVGHEVTPEDIEKLAE